MGRLHLGLAGLDFRLLGWLDDGVGGERRYLLNVVCGQDEPLLVIVATEFDLADLAVGHCLAAFDVQGHTVGEGHQVAGFPGPLALGDRHNLDEAALKIPGVDLDKSSITLIFVLDPDGCVTVSVDECIFMIILQDFEDLTGGAKIVIKHYFLTAILQTQCLLLVKNAYNFVGCLSLIHI